MGGGFGSVLYDHFSARWTYLLNNLREVGVNVLPALETICTLAFSHTVYLDFILVSGGSPQAKPFTINDARRTGILYLTPASTDDQYYVFIPFLQLKWMNTKLCDKKLFDESLLFFPTSIKPWEWHDMELILPYFFVVLVKSLLLSTSIKGNDKSQPLTLFSIFRGASGSHDLPTECLSTVPTRVLFEEKSVISSKETIASPTGELPYITTANSMFVCSKNTKHIDHRTYLRGAKGKYMVLIQAKHSDIGSQQEEKKIRVEPVDLRNWYQNTMKDIPPAKGESQILLYFTNRTICKPQTCLDDFKQYCLKNQLQNRGLVTEALESPDFYHTQEMDM
eukprot:gene12382-14528_t